MNTPKIFTQCTHSHKRDMVINIVLISIAVIILSLGLARVIPMSATAKEHLKQAKILAIMTQIDDIAHKEHYVILQSVDGGYNTHRDRVFRILDNMYHTTQDREEKFKIAMELNELLKEQRTFLCEKLDLHEFTEEQRTTFEVLQQEIENIIRSE